MVSRKVWILAGVLAVVGTAASVAAVGHRHRPPGFMGDLAEAGDGVGDDLGGGRAMGAGGPGRHHGGMGPGMGRGLGGFWQRGPRPISKDQFDTRVRERFARLDKNSDGVIDASEVEAALDDAHEHARTGDRMAQRMIARFDTNHDGKVTRDEFLERVKKEFARGDLNNDGRITDDDLPPMMRSRDILRRDDARRPMLGGTRAGPFGGMLDRLVAADANKDGVITLDEVIASAGKRFDTFDRNKDGVVDQSDFDAMRKEMTDYRIQRFMHRYGADKDRKVTRDQFTAVANERFAERDSNRDGRIDREDDAGMGGGPGRGRRGDMMGPGDHGGTGEGPGMRDRRPVR